MLDMLLRTSADTHDVDALRYVQSTATLLGVRPAWLRVFCRACIIG